VSLYSFKGKDKGVSLYSFKGADKEGNLHLCLRTRNLSLFIQVEGYGTSLLGKDKVHHSLHLRGMIRDLSLFV
jgi:hypothetical protein